MEEGQDDRFSFRGADEIKLLFFELSPHSGHLERRKIFAGLGTRKARVFSVGRLENEQNDAER